MSACEVDSEIGSAKNVYHNHGLCQESHQIPNLELLNVIDHPVDALAFFDADSCSTYGSYVEDVVESVATKNSMMRIGSTLYQESYAKKHPLHVRSSPKRGRGDQTVHDDEIGEMAFRPTYWGKDIHVMPLSYYPSVSLLKIVKCNIEFFLTVFLLRDTNITGPRLDRFSLGVICSGLNAVRNKYHQLASWNGLSEEEKETMSVVLHRMAPFEVRSGKKAWQSQCTSKTSTVPGTLGHSFICLFQDALTNMACHPDEWVVRYNRFRYHRNLTLGDLVGENRMRLEAAAVRQVAFYSLQAVGIKTAWKSIQDHTCEMTGHEDFPLTVDVRTDEVNTAAQLINLKVGSIRNLAMAGLFVPSTYNTNFYGLDVAVSFKPKDRNRSFVFDGRAAEALLKGQLKVETDSIPPFTQGNDPRLVPPIVRPAAVSSERPAQRQRRNSPPPRVRGILYENVEYATGYTAEMAHNPVVTHGMTEETTIADATGDVLNQLVFNTGNLGVEERNHENRSLSPMSEDNESLNSETMGRWDDYDAAAFPFRQNSTQSYVHEEVTDPVAAGVSRILARYMERDTHDEEDIMDDHLDPIELAETMQVAKRIAYCLFGTWGKIGNAHQHRSYITPFWVSDEHTGGFDNRLVAVPCPAHQEEFKVAGQKTYSDGGRTLFMRETRPRLAKMNRYLSMEMVGFLKEIGGQTEGEVPETLKEKIRHMGYIFASVLDDIRMTDRWFARTEYTLFGNSDQIFAFQGPIVDEQQCPLHAIRVMRHSQMYHSMVCYQFLYMRPLKRFMSLDICQIRSMYSIEMMNAIVGACEAMNHFLQHGGIIQGTIHHRVLQEIGSTTFWQVPSNHHVPLTEEQKSGSLLFYGLKPELLPLQSDEFIRCHPRARIHNMEALVISKRCRNAAELVLVRNTLFYQIFQSSYMADDTVGALSELPLQVLASQPKEAIDRFLGVTAELVHRMYVKEWSTVLMKRCKRRLPGTDPIIFNDGFPGTKNQIRCLEELYPGVLFMNDTQSTGTEITAHLRSIVLKCPRKCSRKCGFT